MQGPMEEQGSGGSTITCEIEGAGSGRKGGREEGRGRRRERGSREGSKIGRRGSQERVEASEAREGRERYSLAINFMII